MMRLVLNLRWVLIGFGLAYGGAMAAALLWGPLAALPERLKIQSGYLGSVFHAGPRPIVLVGASNIGDLASDHVLLSSRLPGRSIHNWSTGGFRLEEMEAAAAYFGNHFPAARRQEAVVVLGLWYGTFVDVAGSPPAAPLPLAPFAAGKQVLSSLQDLALHAWATRMNQATSVVIADAPHAGISDPQLFREQYRAFQPGWQDRFQMVVQRFRAAGARVLVVELPLPRWHAEAVPLWAAYRAAPRDWARGDQGVAVLDLSALDDAGDFIDATHASRLTLDKWAGRIAESVNSP